MITNSGLGMVRDLLIYGNTSRVTHIAVGSGTSTPIITNSGLQFETNRSSVLLSNTGSPTPLISFSGLILSVTAGSLASIGECGLFSALVGWSMFSRAKFDSIVLDAGSDYLVEWDVSVV